MTSNWQLLVTAYRAGAIIAAVLFVTGSILGSIPNLRTWPIWLATVTVPALVVLVGERVVRSKRERVMWALVTLLGGWWLAVTAGAGMTEVQAALVIWGLIGFPAWWWWHRRIRKTDRRVRDLVEQWNAAAHAEGLEGTVLAPVMDHATGNWRARVQLPDGMHAEDVKRVVRRLESRMHYPPDAITVERDRDDASVVELAVTVTRPTAEPVPWPGAPRDATIIRPVTIGTFHDGGSVEVPLRGQVILIGGQRGSGKSNAVNELVGHLAACRDAVIVGIDLKHGVELGPWRPVLSRLAVTLEEAEDMLRDECAVMSERLRGMAGHERDWTPTPERPTRVIVIDEVSELVPSKEAVVSLERLARLSRAAGVTIIMATQYPTKDTVGSKALLEQVTVALGFRVKSPVASRALFGENATSEGWNPHSIDPKQRGTFYIDTTPTPRLARAWLVTDAKVRETVRRYRKVDAAQPQPPPVRRAAPAGLAPPEHTQPDNTDGSSGGEADPILELLFGAGERGMSTADLLAALDMPRSTFNYRLSKLRESGRVTSAGHGLWRAV